LKLLLCGHGYLGQAISRDFLAAGWNVIALSRGPSSQSEIHNPQSAIPPSSQPTILPLSCDISSPESVRQLAAHSPDFIIHCAASGKGGPDVYRQVYLHGCQNLTETFPGVPLLFTSSTSVYAQIDGSEVTEQSPAEPDRETGKILLETEQHVLTHGGLITRLAGIYGPHRSMILKKFFSGEAIIEEDGSRIINQIHRDDAAAAILHLANPESTIRHPKFFNLCDSSPLTQREVYQSLSQTFQKPLPPSGPRDLDRKRGWTHKRVSNAKLRATGWEPIFPSFLDAAASVATTME
jgi:nucleoside-diphosphate-sugar epimerase